jgi:hypothetical protein
LEELLVLSEKEEAGKLDKEKNKVLSKKKLEGNEERTNSYEEMKRFKR